MELPIEEENLIFGLLIGARVGGESGGEFFAFIPEYELSKDAIFTYIDNALTAGEIRTPPIQLLEIIVSVVESIKTKHPAIAADIRKMNINYAKAKNNDNDRADS